MPRLWFRERCPNRETTASTPMLKLRDADFRLAATHVAHEPESRLLPIETDVLKDEQSSTYGSGLAWLRFPYLAEGHAEKRDAARKS